MARRDFKQADVILSADWHLEEGTPIARTDNYREAIERKLSFISDLQNFHDCPILVAGDIFDKWKSSPELLAWALEHMPMNCIVIPGQHDLPGHNFEMLHRSSLAVMEASGIPFTILPRPESEPIGFLPSEPDTVGFPWNAELKPYTGRSKQAIALCHILISDSKKEQKIFDADDAHSLFKKLKGFDLIVTGDNHKPFVLEQGGRLLVNPGSLMRRNASQIDHQPRVYLWYADSNTVEAVYLPIEEGVVSREHLEITQERDERMEAFVSSLNTDVEIGLSFEENLKKFIKQNRIRRPVEKLVWEMVKGGEE